MSKSTKWMKKGFAWLLCLIMMTGMLSSAASAEKGPEKPAPGGPGGPGAGGQTVVTEPKGTVEIQSIMFTDRVWVDDGGEANGGYYFNVSFALSKAPENGTYSAEIRWLKQVTHNSAEEIESLKTVKELSLSKDNKTDSIQGLQMGVDTLALAGGGSGRYYLIVDLLYTGEDGSTKKVATNATDSVSITHKVKLTFKNGSKNHNKDAVITLDAGGEIKANDMPFAEVKPGYVLVGWKNESTGEYIVFTEKVTRGGTYKAVCKPNITVTYNYNNHYHKGMSSDVPGATDDDGKVIRNNDLDVCTSGNHVFVDWFEDSYLKNTFKFDVVPTKNVTIYAGWGHSVAFDLSGHGNAIATKRVLQNHKFDMPEDPSDENWEFAGWTWYKVDKNGKRTKLTDKDFENYNKNGLSCNLCLVAQWNEKITKKEIKLDPQSEYVYNFANVNVKVLDPNGNEIPAEAYTISYKNGNGYDTDAVMNVGTYTATLALTEAGKNSYIIAEDGGEVSFKIVPKTITGLVWSNDNFTYDGEAHFPTVTEVIGLCDGDTCEINIVVDEAKKAGENYTARANGAKNTNYKLDADVTQNLEKKFSIAKREVTFEWGNTTFIYDGKNHVPSVKEGSLDGFVKGDAVSYKITANKHETKEIGDDYKATFSLEGKSAENYEISSEATTKFSIVKASNSIEVQKIEDGTATVAYGSSTRIEFIATVHKENAKFTSSDEDVAKIVNGSIIAKKVGEATITITIEESTHHTDATAQFKVVVVPKEVDVIWEITDSFTYTGGELYPKVAWINGAVGNERIAYTITGRGTDVGKYTAKVVLNNSNYKIKSGETKDYKITKANSQISVKEIKKTYTDDSFEIADPKFGTLKVEFPSGSDVAKYNADTKKVEILNAGSVRIKLVFDGNDNYFGSSKYVMLTVNPMPVTLSWENLEFDWDGEEHCPSVTVIGIPDGYSCGVSVKGASSKADTHKATAVLDNKNFIISGKNSIDFIIKKYGQRLELVLGKNAVTEYTMSNGWLPQLSTHDIKYIVHYNDGSYDNPARNLSANSSQISVSKIDYAKLGKQTITVTYTCDNGNELTATYEITLRQELNVIWSSTNTFVYNGQEQGPEATIRGFSSIEGILKLEYCKDANTVDHTYSTAKASLTDEAAEKYTLKKSTTTCIYYITRKPVTLSWDTDDAAFNYLLGSAFDCDYYFGSAVVAPKASLSGVIDGEESPLTLTITGSRGEEVTATDAVGEYKITATLSNNYKFADNTKNSVTYRIINKVSGVDIIAKIPQCGEITDYSVSDIKSSIAYILHEFAMVAISDEMQVQFSQREIILDAVASNNSADVTVGGLVVADALPVTEIEDIKVIEAINWASLVGANSGLNVKGILIPQVDGNVSDMEGLCSAIDGIKDGRVKVTGETTYSVLLFVTANEMTAFDVESVKNAIKVSNATVRMSYVTKYGVIVLADISAVHNYDEKNPTVVDPKEDEEGSITVNCYLVQDDEKQFNHDFKTTIPALEVSGIKVNEGYKDNYNVGDALDCTGLSILVSLSNNEEAYKIYDTTETVEVTADMVKDFDTTEAGTKTVTVEYKGQKATFEITVSKKQSSIDLKNIGEKVTVTYGDNPIDLVFDAFNGDVNISSSNENVAKVENGKLVIVGAGEAEITLEIKDTNAVEGFKKSFKFVVDQKVVGLEWSKDNTFTEDGAKHSLTAKATGLVGTDSCDVIVEGGSTEVGTHTVTATGLSNKNYKLPEKASTTFVIKAKEEPKKEDPKAEEPKKEDPKAEEPKKENPKAEEPKKEETKIKADVKISNQFKDTYVVGEKFDPTGLTLEIENADGTKTVIPVTNEMVSGFDSSKVGNGEAIITYEDFSKKIPVTIVEKGEYTFTITTEANGDMHFVVVRKPGNEIAYSLYLGTYIDGKLVPADGIKTWSGSVHGLLFADYLKTLPAGDHKIEVVFKDGKAVATLTIPATTPASDASPVTGDTSSLTMWIILLAAAAAVLVAIRVYAAKRSNAE